MEDTWESLSISLSESTLHSVKSLGFLHATPVQTACIPLFLKNKDVAAEAVTGSGKTLAFVIPIIEILLKNSVSLRKHDVGAIILTPTRELATQIFEVLGHFLNNLPTFSSLLLIGGTSTLHDYQKFKENGGHIIVATPGRLKAMLEHNQDGVTLGSSMKALEVLVLDEADRLLDMGFEPSINAILSFLPKQRRTGLFSATQTSEVEKLIRAGLRNPVRITVKEKNTSLQLQTDRRTPSSLGNYYTVLESNEKFNYLVHFIRQHKTEKLIVFFSTCACVDYFSKALQVLVKKTPVLCIHGKMKQKRHKIFNNFRDLEHGVLVCTDVMARGVDIPAVSWVIQYDPPRSAEFFVHRCGRTARMGNIGNALLFLLPSEETYVKFIQINQKTPIEKLDKEDVLNNSISKLRKFAMKDRDFHEKSIRAFVSHIQSYAKHECSFIFRIKDLNFGKLATGFGLLRIPKMPELKNRTVTDFEPAVVDFEKLSYRDKHREKQRQENLKLEQPVKKRFKKSPSCKPWSKQKEKREKKIKRREKKELSMKRKLQALEEDKEDLDKDIRLIKKLKKGQISEEDFDKEFVESSNIVES